ncbi:gamma-glutamyl-gamma-aminobutyrate hydrolase family protein [Bacillus sp. JCM 19041]|uniref:gamma-glutamyl-gamma-aminobutyrate hydrolase family protein n=1 Tax=Bacillus sp. JCM 19041 TaxID=1460637 RepID=UPI0006D18E7C
MSITIGITSSIVDEGRLSTALDNIAAVNKMDALPFVLPNIEPEKAYSYVSILDGLLLTGGGDINPALFNEDPHPALGNITPERDVFEYALAKVAIDLKKPILAICRGMQVLAIAAGGGMYQDLPAQHTGTLIQHKQLAPRSYGSHKIHFAKHSLIEQIAGSEEAYVNSFHHQAVSHVPATFKVSAWTNDTVIEAIEATESTFQLGVQWHPENMNDQFSRNLFRTFLQACVIEKKN